MSASRVLAGLLVVVLAACASADPAEQSAAVFDAGAGTATVVLHDDGWVTLDGARVPFEKAVLELRFRTRAMAAADREARFVVQVRAERAASERGTEVVADNLNRMLDQLQIMNVKQVEIR
jgi:hypothetical protein